MSETPPTGRAFPIAAASALATGLVFSAFHAGGHAASPPPPEPKGAEARARAACSSCHAFPGPEILPRSSWRREVVKMALIREGKGIPAWGEAAPAEALTAGDRDVLGFYEAGAPVALPTPEPWPSPGGTLRFVSQPIGFPDALTPEPAVANVRVADIDGDGAPEVLACDMRQGVLLAADPAQPGRGAAPLAMVPNPDHVAVVPVPGRSRPDLLIADLGGFFPGDHAKGAAVWLRAGANGGFIPFTLPALPRVADVEAADFDGDGRQDLLVAAFGWWKTGGITLFLDRTPEGGGPAFEQRPVDSRAGPIHVAPADLDGDGRMDFVALFAQEHEAVVAFLGDGKGGFRALPLYAAPQPNWGSSGLQLVDLDRDGDLDVLVTNGDMFDDDILKPYHGIQWLENRGRLRFEAHWLAALAGAHRAVAVDLDGDGDLDVAASAFVGAAGSEGDHLPALVWLEQVKPRRFERRTIANGRPRFPTLDAADVDGDGDVDLVTGTFLLQGRSNTWVEVWENQLRSPASRVR